MDDADIISIIEQQSDAAKQRQKEIKRYIFITWVYILIVTGIFSFSVYTLSQSNNELSDVLNRRSPILEYILCHDERENDRSIAQTEYLNVLIDVGSDVTDEELNKIIIYRNNLAEKERILSETTSKATIENPCPDVS